MWLRILGPGPRDRSHKHGYAQGQDKDSAKSGSLIAVYSCLRFSVGVMSDQCPYMLNTIMAI